VLKVKAGRVLGRWEWGQTMCDACLLEIEEGVEPLKCENCGANFHPDCYTSLKNTKAVCPKCKVTLE
jgi:Zn finger protein HypA/HybF involved in hydrogenase expression